MEYRHLIDFVPAGSNPDGQKILKRVENKEQNGEEIKTFYEEIVRTNFSSTDQGQCSNSEQRNTLKNQPGHRPNKCTSSFNVADTTCKVKIEKCDSAKTVKCDQNNDIKCDVDFVGLHRKHASLLSFSQNGHFGQLEKLLKENLVDLNFQDQYGWTALMCAAVGGHFDVVLLLLNHGASRYATNSKGETVDDLCPNIDHHVDRLQQQHVITKHVPKFEPFYCEVCSLKFSDTSREEHATSTVHLFNSGLKPKTDNFSIQSNNVGFQLMQKSGWDGESGLGTKGQGQKYPVKTSLKRDRRCLGNGEKEKLKPKVTHFGPNDETAVKSLLTRDKRVISARTISRQERNRKINTDKKWERHLRTYMNLD